MQPPAPRLLSFGHAALAQRLVGELTDSLRPGAGSTTEPALVVGVFGEWGAGKSRLLQTVAEGIDPGDGKETLTVVVPFNAWRYEREEHLLVPLLKVAQQCLRKALETSVDDATLQRERLSDRLVLVGELAQTVYQHGGRELAQAALAAQGVTVKLPELKGKPGGADKGEPSAWARWRQRRETLAQARRLILPADGLNSLYYDFLEHLKAVTGRNPRALALHRERLRYGGLGWWPRLRWHLRAALGWIGTGERPAETDFRLNLVFLVDDLDRCLPDKAVEVLEAIKLFLEVEGCAFVLALDEEVVERGIAHRYRDYTLQGREGLTPITGAEYLEKLVHLPVRLPRPTRAEAEDFLALKHPELFAEAGVPNSLARLVAAITPPVPRKLHRMIDLLEMADQLATPLGNTGPQRRQWLVVGCALQLFAPSLYRYLRLRGATLLLTLAEWRDDTRLRDLDALREQLAKELRAVSSPARLNYHLALLRLPDLCAAAMQNRSGFDLLELLAQVGEMHRAAPLRPTELGAMLAFTEAKAEEAAVPSAASAEAPVQVAPVATEPATPQPPAMPPPAQSAPPKVVSAVARHEPPADSGRTLPEARLEDERGLLEALVTGDPELMRFALSKEGEALRGRYLPAGFWTALCASPWAERLQAWVDEGMPPSPVEQSLRDLRPYLTQAMAMDLMQHFGAPLHAVLRRPSWARRVETGEQFRVLTPPLEAERPLWLATRDVASAPGWATPGGWPCKTMPLLTNQVDDLSAALKMGADEQFGVFALLTVTRSDGTRPVTQRLRWMAPGDFNAGSPLTEAGRAPDEPLPRGVHLSEGFWVADTACTWGLWWMLMPGGAPADWNVDQDNDPATGLAPEQALAFLHRLWRLLPSCKALLPDEWEWEYACRAGTDTPWAFGTMVNGTQVQMLAGAPARVASLPPNDWGLYEMHGNVAEICRVPRTPGAPATSTPEAPRFTVRGGSFADPVAATRAAATRAVRINETLREAGFRFTLRAREPGDLPDQAAA